MPLALFDLDNTLVDRGHAVTQAISRMCAAHHFSPEAERWLRTELADRAGPGDFTRLRAAFSLDQDAGQLWQEYIEAMAAAVTCRPAIQSALTQLRAEGWTIGIVTNGASDIQRAKLAATGLDALVDGVAVSGDLEVRKPDPRLFELAAARCGLPLTGGWMIGDNPAGDIGGGHQARLRTIWLRGRPWPDGLPDAHHTVDDVTDAIKILLTTTSE